MSDELSENPANASVQPAASQRLAEPPDRDPLGRGYEDQSRDGPHEPAPDADHLIIAEVVRRVHGGELAATALTPEMRQQCVGQLTLEGFTSGEIAQLMRISERTVRRDRATVRRDDALAPARSLGDELLGEFQRLTLASVQRLTRLARDPDAPHYARLWAEESIVRIYQRFIDTAHRLRYIEDGRARLAHQRDTDPAEQERFRETLASLRGIVSRG